MIKIIAKREGHRRCGMAHSVTATTYAVDYFTPEQLAILQADPTLTVTIDDVEVDDEPIEAATSIDAMETSEQTQSTDAGGENTAQPAPSAKSSSKKDKAK